MDPFFPAYESDNWQSSLYNSSTEYLVKKKKREIWTWECV